MRLTLLPAKTKTKAAIAAAILIILSQGVLPGLSFRSRAVSAAPAEGALVRIASNSAVYYVGRDGKRYVFPNEATYFSWYHNFDNVQVIGDGELANLPIGYLIPVRPNVRFVRFDGEAKVYAVEPGGLLRWIPDEATFSRFGFRLDQVVSLPDVFRPAYTEGPVLVGAPNGVAVRSGQGGQLYYVRDGVKRPVTEQVLRQNRYFTNHIRVVAPEVIAVIPDGPSLGGFDQAVAGRPDDRPGAASVNPPPEQVPTSTAPNAPRNFSAVGGSQQVTLNWTAPSGGVPVSSYLLYRSFVPIVNINGSGVTPVASRPASTTNYADAGLAASTTYYYAIRAQGASGALGAYVTTSASTLRADAAVPPNPPTSLQATGGNRSASLSWTLSSTPGVTNYAVFRSTSFFNHVEAAGVTALATTSGSATSYAATNLASSTQYFFGVRARGSNGVYSALVVTSATTQGSGGPTSTPPNPPTSFVASSTQGAIGLGWGAPNGGGAAASYQLLRSMSPIVNPSGPGVTTIATLPAPATYYRDSNLQPSTAYYYAIRSLDAVGVASGIVTVSAATPALPLDRVLHLPEPPDNVVNADGLQYSKNLAAMAASLGINKLMVPTRYYQGLNDLHPSYGPTACVNHVGRFCGPYNEFLSFVDGLRTPDGRPVQVVFLSAKLTKSPMVGGDPSLKGAIQLKQMGAEPYDFLSRLSQTSGTLPPQGQGEHRAFVSVSFPDPAERDRLLRLTTNITGDGVQIRWYPEQWETAKFRDTVSDTQYGLGTRTFDFPNPTVTGNRYLLMIMNRGTVPLNWEIQSLQEVSPVPSTVRGQDATTYDWLGNTDGYLTYGYNHPRYALDETRTRFIAVQAAVWNEFSHHPSLVGLMGNGDEPHAMFWMPEDTARFQNAGHELAEFEKAVAAGQYAVTQRPYMLFGDPRDPTHNGISTGVYASNMAGGGFSDMASRFNGTEPIEWILWGDAAAGFIPSRIAGFTSQGFGVYLMAALYDPTHLVQFGRWVSAAGPLPPTDKARVKGWFYYAEDRSHVSQQILEAAIAATPSQL